MTEAEPRWSSGTGSQPGDGQPLFSIIIPTYDRPELLGEALESVLAQQQDSFECIVVDDGGPRAPVLPQDPRFRLVRRTCSGGASAARNSGLDAAIGRYVTFMDDDDTYTSDRLSMVVARLAEDPVVICWRNGGHRRLAGDVSNVILDDLVPHLGQVSLRREVVPRFDEQFYGSEDVEWWLRLALQQPVTTVPEIGYLYRVHTGPRHRNGLEARIRGLELLLDRHGSYFDAHRRAKAFQLKQIGLAQRRLGNDRLARTAFRDALRVHPEPRTALHLVRSLF